MATHVVRVKLTTEQFDETVTAGSVREAERTAKQRNPGAVKVWWVRETESDSKRAQREKREADHRAKVEANYNLDRVEPQNPWTNNRSSSSSSSSSEGGGGILVLGVGAVVLMAVIAFVMLTAPIIAAGGTGVIAKRLTKNTGSRLRILLVMLMSVGSFAGTVTLQKEYMPEVVSAQVEVLTEAKDMVVEQFNK